MTGQRIANLPREEWTDDACRVFSFWGELSKFLNTQQLMDFVFTVGQYVTFSWAISSFGIPLQDGVHRSFDLKTAPGRVPGSSERPGESDDWAEKSGD